MIVKEGLVVGIEVSVIQVQEVHRHNHITGDGSVHLICSANVGDKVCIASPVKESTNLIKERCMV